MNMTHEEKTAYNYAYKSRITLLKAGWIGAALAVLGFGILFVLGIIAEFTGKVHSEAFPVVMFLCMAGTIPMLILGCIRCKKMFSLILQFAAPLALFGWIVIGITFTFALAIAGSLGPVFLIIDTIKYIQKKPLT